MRLAVPLAVAVAVVLTFVVPTIRLRMREGRWPVAFQKRSLAELLMFLALSFDFALLGVWAVLYAVSGPEAVRVRPVDDSIAAIGWLIGVAGLALIVVAQSHMGRSWRVGIDAAPTSLVTTGVFAHVRNPIYSGLVLATVMLAMVAPCPVTLFVVLSAIVLVPMQARLEERHLLAMHGAPYRDYASRVGRFVPGVGRIEAS